MGVNIDASDLREALWDFMQKWEANHQWVFTDLTDALVKHTEALKANTAALTAGAPPTQSEPYTGDLQGQIKDLQLRMAAAETQKPIAVSQQTIDHILNKINEIGRRVASLEQGQSCASTDPFAGTPDPNLMAT